jgi:hypothetical protein
MTSISKPSAPLSSIDAQAWAQAAETSAAGAKAGGHRRPALSPEADEISVTGAAGDAWAAMPRKASGFFREILHIDPTPVQSVLIRCCLDSEDPTALDEADRGIAKALFGDVDTLPPGATDQIVWRLGRASGKSLLAAATMVWRAVVGHVNAGVGAETKCVVMSRRMETSEIVFGIVRALIKATPAIHACVVKDLVKEIVIARPDGHDVVLKNEPRSAGGESLRGFDCLCLVIDESEFVNAGDPQSAASDAAAVAAVTPRLRGPIIFCSTPWPGQSVTSDLFDQNWGKPTYALCALGATLFVRPDQPELAAKIERERARDPGMVSREYECVITSDASYYFDLVTIAQCVAIDRPVATRRKVSAGVDLGFIADYSALVIVERRDGGSPSAVGEVAVIHTEVLKPEPGKPLQPTRVIAHFAEVATSFGCKFWSADQYYIASVRELAIRCGVQTHLGPGSGQKCADSWAYLRDLMRDKLITLYGADLVATLRGVLVDYKAGGWTIPVLAHAPGLGHFDLLQALRLAVWLDHVRHGELGPREVPTLYEKARFRLNAPDAKIKGSGIYS